MTINAKHKGNRWERDCAKLLNKSFPETWRRIALSGALGTVLGDPLLESDLLGKYEFLSRRFCGEAKVGYGGKEMKVKKLWFDKIASTAERCYGLPAVLLKFNGARSGVRHVIAFDFETWDKLMLEVEQLSKDHVRALNTVKELTNETDIEDPNTS